MGERELFQPLTGKDKITVVLYRAGIVISTLIISVIAYASFNPSYYQNDFSAGLKFNVLILSLYAGVGMSVFFIHLYVSKFHSALKKLYYISLAALAALLLAGNGDMLKVVANEAYGPVLLIPVSGCLGFITAKEAFCFKLAEGYLIALIMPLYLFLLSLAGVSAKGVSYGLLLIASMLVLFTLRKIFMPIHYDIGDKSAYS